MMEFYAPTCSVYRIEVGNVGEATKAVMMTGAAAPTVNGFAIVVEVSRAEFEDMKIHAQTAIPVAAERIEADCEGEGDTEADDKILYRAPDETGDTVTYFKHPSGLIKVNNFATALSVFKFMYETDDSRAKAWFNIAYSMPDAP